MILDRLRALRVLAGRLVPRRAPAPTFARVLDDTLRDADAFTLRLSTVERSVGIAQDRPRVRASQE